MKTRYYGEYKSIMTQTNGCVSALVSKPRETMDFPQMITHSCEPCRAKNTKHSVHGFRLANTLMIGNDSQRDALESRCKASNTPFEIDI